MKEANKQKKWDREEVVILVNEYFENKNLSVENIKECKKNISEFLRKREKMIAGVEVNEIFRDYAGINMQFGRIQCLDPDTKYSGMQGTKLQKEVVQEYLRNPRLIKDEADAIYKKYQK